MNLAEAITKYQGRIGKIGAHSSFLYIDKLNDQTYDELRSLDVQFVNGYKNDINQMESRLEELTTPQPLRATQLTDRLVLPCKIYSKIKPELAEQKCRDGIEKAKKRLTEYKPLLERQVLEVYKSCSEPCIENPDGIIIRVEGEENGKYWTMDEYLRGKKGVDPEAEEDDDPYMDQLMW